MSNTDVFQYLMQCVVLVVCHKVLCLSQDKLVDSLSSVKTSGSQLHVTAESWLSGDIQASFKAWRKNMPHKGEALKYIFNQHILLRMSMPKPFLQILCLSPAISYAAVTILKTSVMSFSPLCCGLSLPLSPQSSLFQTIVPLNVAEIFTFLVLDKIASIAVHVVHSTSMPLYRALSSILQQLKHFISSTC